MKLNITAASYVGCVRANNEDMVLVDRKFIRNDKYWTMHDLAESDRYLIALADGMGGHNSGEVASEMTLHNLQYYFSDLPSALSTGDFNEALFDWLQSINNIIESKGIVEPRFQGMGTTLVALAYYGGHFFWLNCGDSRIYRYHDHELRQLSTDHSLNNLTGRPGHSNIITNCIGGGCKMSYFDIVECTTDMVSGDEILLCSDGLTDMLSDEQLIELLASGCDASKLCHAAEEAGGYDNVTTAVIKIV